MTTKQIPTNALRFKSPVQFADAEVEREDGQRRFSGVAYSGEAITGHWFWDSVIFDLDTMEVPERLPALIGHDRDKIAGYADSAQISNQQGLVLEGPLSQSGEWGQRVAETSDEGFPWQMSVHINPGRIEEIDAGNSVTVNGRTFQGPGFVFRDSRIREVSFTPTGFDDQTTARAMSDEGGGVPVTFEHQSSGAGDMPDPNSQTTQPSQGQGSQGGDTSQQFADLQASLEAEKQARQAAEEQARQYSEQLANERLERRKQDVQALFSELGREYSDEMAKPYLDMSEEAFAQVAKDLRATRPSAPQGAFQHQADGNGQDDNQGGTDAQGMTAEDRQAIEFAANL